MYSLKKSSALYHTVIIVIINTTLISMMRVEDNQVFLNNLKLPHWDDWGTNASCPPNLFVTGLRAKTLEVYGQTSVTALQILCSDEVNPRNKTTRSVYLGGPSGDWKLLKKCKVGFVVGILAVQSPIHASFPGSSFQIYCSDETPHEALSVNGANRTKGPAQFCDTGDALVGITVKVERIFTIQKGETAAMNNIFIQCKSVSNPVTHHNIEYGWEKRKGKMDCVDVPESKVVSTFIDSHPEDNSKMAITVNCSYKSWTGVGLNPHLHWASHAINVYQSMGFHNNQGFVKWSLLVRIFSSDSRKVFLQKFSSQPRLMNDFAEQMLDSDFVNYTGVIDYKIRRHPIPSNLFKKMRSDPSSKLELKHDPALEQYVGNCAMYQVAFALFRTVPHSYIETLVNKRITQIVFSEFDLAKLKIGRK